LANSERTRYPPELPNALIGINIRADLMRAVAIDLGCGITRF